jgi:hypothetical protein
MPALSTFVTTTTQSRLLPKVVDNVLNGNVLSMRLMRDAKTWRGGTSIDIPVNLSNITGVGSYFGFDVFDTTQENIRQRAVFTPSQYYVNVSISGIQQAINQGDAAVINLVAQELDWRAKRLKDEFGTDLYLDGTGNSSKAFLGLGAAVDDSTNVTTYGTLSRSTYTNWQATLTAQSGSLSLANLAADFDAAQIGGDAPTLMVSTPAVFSIYEALLTPTVSHQFSMNDFRATSEGIVRVGGTVAANQGFRALTFRGIPFIADEKCTSGNIYTLNENHLSFYSIPQVGRSIKNEFAWTGFKEPANQDATTGQLLWYGQLICDSPRTQARRTGVTS